MKSTHLNFVSLALLNLIQNLDYLSKSYFIVKGFVVEAFMCNLFK